MHPRSDSGYGSDRGSQFDRLLKADRVQHLPIDSLLFFLVWPARRKRRRRSDQRDPGQGEGEH